jgi:hypothetical protein
MWSEKSSLNLLLLLLLGELVDLNNERHIEIERLQGSLKQAGSCLCWLERLLWLRMLDDLEKMIQY